MSHDAPRGADEAMINPALIGKAGELLVAAELMRRGVEVAHPHSDIGVDLIAYRLQAQSTLPTTLAAIQVKSASGVAYNFHKRWLLKAPVLVLAWRVATTPEFYVFSAIDQIEAALGKTYSASSSWINDGRYTVTKPSVEVLGRMVPHRDRWDRIISQL
jgi:hypothetical protein